jgi:hypothetical protein
MNVSTNKIIEDISKLYIVIYNKSIEYDIHKKIYSSIVREITSAYVNVFNYCPKIFLTI